MCDYETVFQDTDEIKEIYYDNYVEFDYPEISLEEFLSNFEEYLNTHPAMEFYSEWYETHCISQYFHKYNVPYVIVKDVYFPGEFDILIKDDKVHDFANNKDFCVGELEDNFRSIQLSWNQKRFNKEKKQKEKKINDFISSRLYNPRTPWGEIFVKSLYMKDC